MSFEPLPETGLPRRAMLLMPAALVGWIAVFRRPERPLPNAAADGTGSSVQLLVLSTQDRRELLSLHKISKTDAEWRRELTSSEYAVTRRAATELPFANRYWHTKTPGAYFCTCCGTALFLSRDKFDSGTGWPSFAAPIAPQNIQTRIDNSLSVPRTEVLCRKCDAHLGHVFDDGPPPSGLRYCLNSAALRFIECKGRGCAPLVTSAAPQLFGRRAQSRARRARVV